MKKYAGDRALQAVTPQGKKIAGDFCLVWNGHLSYSFERLSERKPFTGTYHMPVWGIVHIAGYSLAFQSLLSVGGSPEPILAIEKGQK